METLGQSSARKSSTTQDHNFGRIVHQKRSLHRRDAPHAQNVLSSGPAAPCKRPRTKDVAPKALTAPTESNAPSVYAHHFTGANLSCYGITSSINMHSAMLDVLRC